MDGLQIYPSDRNERKLAAFVSLLMSAINTILSTNENDIISLPIWANLIFSTFLSIPYTDLF